MIFKFYSINPNYLHVIDFVVQAQENPKDLAALARQKNQKQKAVDISPESTLSSSKPVFFLHANKFIHSTISLFFQFGIAKRTIRFQTQFQIKKDVEISTSLQKRTITMIVRFWRRKKWFIWRRHNQSHSLIQGAGLGRVELWCCNPGRILAKKQ